MNEDIKNLREILEEMHRIGCSWYEELCVLRKENDELKKNILQELQNQTNWQKKFAEEISTPLVNSLCNNMEEKFKSIADTGFKDIKGTIATLSSIKPDVSSLKTDLSQLLKKPNLDLDDFQNKIVADMGKKIDNLQNALLNDTGDKLSKEDIVAIIKQSLDDLLPDALNKAVSLSVPLTAESEPESEPIFDKTYQSPPVDESSVPDNEETTSQLPADDEGCDIVGVPPKQNCNDGQIFTNQQQDNESFFPGRA